MDIKSDILNRLQLPANASEEDVACPTCSKRLQRHEMAEHCEQEMERLRRVPLKTETDETAVGDASEERRKPWVVFKRVQRNRQIRLKQRTRKRPAAPPPPVEQPQCPVCNASFPQNEIQRHTEQCLRRTNGTAATTNGRDDNSSNDEDESGGVGLDEEYEEYEWAGQKRIRVSSLLQGGYASIGIGQTITNHAGEDDDDEDLNVDEDDTQIYGPAQYAESDVIPTDNPERYGLDGGSDVTSYMRRLITGNSTHAGNTSAQQSLDDNTTNNTNNAKTQHSIASSLPPPPPPPTLTALDAVVEAATSKHSQQIIEALKAKLRHYENHVQSKFKCLICLDDYRNPAISVACWHVHCEECWLRSLGARKLCPQCNLITTPKDLRRIYM